MKKLKPVSRLLILISALSMVSAYYVPLWQILMWAPQYPEGLKMKIWVNNITGDVKIISALNHYIGMKHIEVSMFPEFGYMIYIIGGVIGFGIFTAIVNRRVALWLFIAAMAAVGAAGLIDFYMWGYDYGHNLDPTAPIVVPGMSYQPPLIGTKQLLNFTAYSGPDIGGWIFLAAGLLAGGVLVFEVYRSRMKKRAVASGLAIFFCLQFTACTVEPEALQFGKDGCFHCKMTLVDTKFGGEILTKKGKVYKFDDVNCMLKFYNSGEVAADAVKEVLVVDFSKGEKLIDARKALFIESESVMSPMASNVAAFQSVDDQERMNAEWNGTILTWEEIQTQFR